MRARSKISMIRRRSGFFRLPIYPKKNERKNSSSLRAQMGEILAWLEGWLSAVHRPLFASVEPEGRFKSDASLFVRGDLDGVAITRPHGSLAPSTFSTLFRILGVTVVPFYPPLLPKFRRSRDVLAHPCLFFPSHSSRLMALVFSSERRRDRSDSAGYCSFSRG